MRHFHRARWAVVLSATAWLVAAVVPSSAGALNFSAPARIAKAPFLSTHELTALDCVGGTLCVGGDGAGNLVSTTHPTGGSTAWTMAEQVAPSTRIEAVSCSSRALCVAAGNDGSVIHSTNPTGGAKTWKLTSGVFRSGNAFTSLSCPTKKLCFGVDRRGHVIYSRNPTGGAKSWKFAHVLTFAKDWLASIKCPTTSECIAVDRRGHTVLHSTRPTRGRRAWHRTTLRTRASNNSLPAIDCASRSMCVIAGGQGAGQIPFIGTATRPTGGKSAWKIGKPPKAIENLVAVSCPSTKLCLVGGRTFGTEIAYSTRPSGGARTYRVGLTAPTRPSTGYPAVNLLSCATTHQCVLAGPNGLVAATSKPTSRSTSDWPAVVADAYNKLESVWCPSTTTCVAGGGPQKLVYTSANPTAGGAAWNSTALPIASDRVACSSPTQCVVGDGISGDLAASNMPLNGGWVEAQTSGDLPDGGGISVLACATGPFCIAGPYEIQSDSDDEGTTALTTTNPTGGTSAWSYSTTFIEGGVNGGPRAAKGTVPSLSCPSSTLCVAGDAKGGVLTNTTPANVNTWHYTRPDGTARVNSLSCPTTALCVGVDSQGRVIHSTNPAAGGWSGASIDKGFALTAVSCASTGFCVAVDGHRHGFVSTSPTGGASAWRKISGIDGDLTSISCPTSGLCVAVDSQGNEVTATG